MINLAHYLAWAFASNGKKCQRKSVPCVRQIKQARKKLFKILHLGRKIEINFTVT